MCGRSACTLAPEQIKAKVHVRRWDNESDYQPLYNVSPTMNQPVLLLDRDGNPYIRTMKWGMISQQQGTNEENHHGNGAGSNSNGHLLVNARADTLAATAWKSSNRKSVWHPKLLQQNRCLVIADGYFEWKVDPRTKQRQPYYIHLPEGRLLLLAAIWDTCENKRGELEYTYSLITTDPVPEIQYIHDRMPLILGSTPPELPPADTTTPTNNIKTEIDECSDNDNTNNNNNNNGNIKSEPQLNANNNYNNNNNNKPYDISVFNEKARMWLDCTHYSVEDVLPFLIPRSYSNNVKKDPQQPNKEEKKEVKLGARHDALPRLESYKVPPLVNSWKNNTADCIQRLEEFNKSGGIASFFGKDKVKKKEEPNDNNNNNNNNNTTTTKTPSSPVKTETDQPNSNPNSPKRKGGLYNYFNPSSPSRSSAAPETTPKADNDSDQPKEKKVKSEPIVIDE